MAGSLRIEPLTPSEISTMYEKCVQILTDHGVKVDHEKALGILGAAGALVDRDTHMVRFSRETIEWALAEVPKEVTYKGGDAKHDLVLPHPDRSFHTSTCIQSMLYHDPAANAFADVTHESYTEWCRLIENLPNIDICAIQTPMDVPAETADVHALNIQLQNTSKPLAILAYCLESVPYLFELLLARAGSAEALKDRPLAAIHPTALSPLVFKEMDLETIILACRYGVPIAPASLVMSGGTGPITIPGTAVLVAAEIVAMIVMAQLMCPGLPALPCVYNYGLDMSTGNALMTSPENLLAQATGAQFMKEAFGLPVWVSSMGGDSYVSDGQMVAGKNLQSAMCAMAGTDINYGAGRLGGSNLASPVQLLIDDRMVANVKRVIAGVEVNEDTLALDTILTAGSGGHYLRQRHTRDHCREAVRPDLFVADPLDTWQEKGSKDLYARAVDAYEVARRDLAPLPLPEDVKREMDSIVKRADEHLVP
ncbi:MAG: trimethylamine methyltransferase family protein [Thermoleophilia bacterium]